MPKPCKDLTGQVFGRLTTLRLADERNKQGQAVWVCVCSCDGKEILVPSHYFVNGTTSSCGCFRREWSAAVHRKHGHATRSNGVSLTYHVWESMIKRCTNPHDREWCYYGGAGITVCERWLDFRNFLSDMGEKPEGTSISRFLDIGNYEPGNVEWANRLQQGAERRGKHVMLRLHAYHQLQIQAA